MFTSHTIIVQGMAPIVLASLYKRPDPYTLGTKYQDEPTSVREIRQGIRVDVNLHSRVGIRDV